MKIKKLAKELKKFRDSAAKMKSELDNLEAMESEAVRARELGDKFNAKELEKIRNGKKELQTELDVLDGLIARTEKDIQGTAAEERQVLNVELAECESKRREMEQKVFVEAMRPLSDTFIALHRVRGLVLPEHESDHVTAVRGWCGMLRYIAETHAAELLENMKQRAGKKWDRLPADWLQFFNREKEIRNELSRPLETDADKILAEAGV